MNEDKELLFKGSEINSGYITWWLSLSKPLRHVDAYLFKTGFEGLSLRGPITTLYLLHHPPAPSRGSAILKGLFQLLGR